MHGLDELGLSLINLIGLAFWTVLIRWMTPHPPSGDPIRRPKLEVWVAFGWFAVSFLVSLSFHKLVNLGPISGLLHQMIPISTRAVIGGAFPEWATGSLVNAVQNTVTDLIPLALIGFALGYTPRTLGFTLRYPRLILALLGVSILFAAPVGMGVWNGDPIGQVLMLYVIKLFINGLHEEFFFRGFLLPRLEPFVGGLNAIALSAWFFNAVHIPSHIAQDGWSVLVAVLDSFSTAFPSGLIWGYLYYRTRSVIPGALWHASWITLGVGLMG